MGSARHFRPRGLALFLALALGVFALACGASATATPRPTAVPAATSVPVATAVPAPTEPVAEVATGSLVIALQDFGVQTWEPWIGPSSHVRDFVLEPPLYNDPETGWIIPGLITEWDMSPDGKVWTYTTRENVKFHDGGDFSAEDIAYTAKFGLEKEDLTMDAFVQISKNMASVNVLGPNSVEMVFNSPMPTFTVAQLSQQHARFNVSSKAYWEEVGEEVAVREPIGTGPWKLVDQTIGSSATFDAFNDYWGGVPPFKDLELQFIPEHATRIALLSAGEADIVDLPLLVVDEVEASGFDIVLTPGVITPFMVFGGSDRVDAATYDPDLPWNKDARVREAMALAVDQDAIIQGIYKGRALPAAVPFMAAGVVGFDRIQHLEPYPFDLPKAKQLLADAGYPDGFDVEIRTVSLGGAPELPELAEAMAIMWEALGLNTSILPSDWRAQVAPAFKKQEPMPYLIMMRHSTVPIPDVRLASYSSNYFYFEAGAENDELVALTKSVTDAVDMDVKSDAIAALNQFVYDRYATIPVAITPTAFGVSNKVAAWPTVPGVVYIHNIHLITPGE